MNGNGRRRGCVPPPRLIFVGTWGTSTLVRDVIRTCYPKNAVSESSKILVEVIYKASYCLPCHYMDLAVREVLPHYSGQVEYRRVAFMESLEGKKRFTELSISLYGKEKVYRLERLAPVPSLFIEGRLAFDMIPPQDALEAAIDQALAAKRVGTRH